ncbi:ribonuclease P protein component [Mycoplasmatota bacterium]|nr:ribonuclease P protein component [Mycoplasmatota bacterium]
MKKKYRIKKSDEIVQILKKRKTVGNKYFVIYKSENRKITNFRYAVSVNKKYGNAVERNHIKRQVREIIQKNSSNLEKMDIFIVIKLVARELKFKEIEENIIKLLKKAEMFRRRTHDQV